jgi:hypothetical protein
MSGFLSLEEEICCVVLILPYPRTADAQLPEGEFLHWVSGAFAAYVHA